MCLSQPKTYNKEMLAVSYYLILLLIVLFTQLLVYIDNPEVTIHLFAGPRIVQEPLGETR